MNTPSTASAKKGAPASLPWVVAESKLLDNIAAARVKLENDDPDAYSMDRKEIYQWLAERLEIEGGYKRSAKAIESRLGGRLKFLPSPKKKTPSNSSESGPARKRARLSDHNDSEDAITVEARTPAKDSGVGDGDRVGEPAVAFHGSNTTRSEVTQDLFTYTNVFQALETFDQLWLTCVLLSLPRLICKRSKT